MTVKFVVDVRKDPRIGEYERKFGISLRKEQQQVLNTVGQNSVRLLTTLSANIRWRRRFQTGWRFRTYGGTQKMYLTIWNVEPHAVFVEDGRRAGARPPPVDGILDWVRDKLGGGRATAFAVARKIGRDGIEARRVLTDPRNHAEISRGIENGLTQMIDRILAKGAR